jgi:tetratricopeptide (TPR) repeat protein
MFPSLLEEAQALVVKGAVDEAIQKLGLFLNGEFYHDEALFMLGGCLLAKGMNGLGAVITSAAVDARATKGRSFPEALMNLGAAYKAEHRNQTAEQIWIDALRHETLPRERAKILTNIAGLYVNEGQPETAIEWCDRALKEDPANHGAHCNRGMACLELGRWKEGWEGWRHTSGSGDRQQRRYRDIPVWDGTPGLHVIAWGDQGIGDEIFYAHCLRDLARVCRKVTLDCHPRQPALFRRSFPEFAVHGTRKHLTELDWLHDCDADAAVALADLPGFFRNSDDDWGDGAAYLKACSDQKHDWKLQHIIAEPVLNRRLRIGLSWTGGSKRTRQDLRSLALEQLEPIVRARPDAQWFSLQYTPEAARQVCELEERTGVRIAHYPGWVECHDYDRTASFVGSLDLVITVCTTAHHLAGALGVPCWTLVPSRPSWRYGAKDWHRKPGQGKWDRSPWYGSVRLYRQQRDGVWDESIAQIARDLECL